MTANAVTTHSPRIAIIGGGLTGLAAAHRLIELSRESDRAADVHLFESGEKLGGIVGTVERDGYLIDTGDDSFITNKRGAIDLCRKVGTRKPVAGDGCEVSRRACAAKREALDGAGGGSTPQSERAVAGNDVADSLVAGETAAGVRILRPETDRDDG